MGITACVMTILLAISGGLPEIMWLGNGGMAGSAAAAGMGETWYADGSPQGALENPVMASSLPRGFSAGVTGGAALDIEKRSRRVYDSFGGVVGESEYAFNQGFTPFPGGAAAGWSDGTFSAAAGWRAVGTFSYGYGRVMNDDNYVKVADETLDISGLLSDFSFSGSWSSGGLISLGAGGGFITGTRSSEYTIEYVDPTQADVILDTDQSLSGMVVRGSAMADMGRLVLIAGVEQPMGWKWETEGVDTDLTLPMKIRSGAVYAPGNRLMSVFAADFWWSPTSEVEIDDTDPGLGNSWGFGAGVENTLPGNTIVRAGFNYEASPISSALDRMGFTGGIGWRIGNTAVDAALAFSPVRWDQYEAEGLPTFQGTDSLVVESSRTAFSLGVTRWF
ncbi:MAG TPA: hypothetical protein PK907_02045 [Candidatus Sabulitectum sp.]|nr:hypothetical protein [Candidatus Sabulitectum sp.]